MGKLTIFTSGNKAVIDNVDKKDVRLFGDFVRNKISSKDNAKSDSKSIIEDEDVISKLERLAVLKEKGILTDEEFISQKMKILDS